MSGFRTERTIDFTNESRTHVKAKGFVGELDYGPCEELTPDVRVKTWKFREVDDSLRDGALVEVKPGGRTPVQLVESDTTFYEVPLSGKLVFLSVDPEGKVSAYLFDSSRGKDASFMMEVTKGSIMCWVAPPQEKPAQFLEYEEPGFKVSKLTNIESGTSEVGGKQIPEILWQIIKQLKDGKIDNTIIQIVDIGDKS